jgi:hypothetical protein
MEPFSGNPRILSAATAVPLHEVRQEEIKEFAPIYSRGNPGTWNGSSPFSTTVR